MIWNIHFDSNSNHRVCARKQMDPKRAEKADQVGKDELQSYQVQVTCGEEGQGERQSEQQVQVQHRGKAHTDYFREAGEEPGQDVQQQS